MSSNNWCIGDALDKLCYDEEANDLFRAPTREEWRQVVEEKGIQARQNTQDDETSLNSKGSWLSRASRRSARSKQSQKSRDTKSKEAAGGEETDVETIDGHTIQAKVFMISGCEDSQTSADVSNVNGFSLPDPNGRAGGACTSALLSVLYNNGKATDMTFVQVLEGMRRILRRGNYTQNPQLTSSHAFDTSQSFYIVPPNCTGTRRAVLIGINYEGQNGELSGCHNDCLNMKNYIMEVWGFSEQNILVLMDDGEHTHPTRSNILKAYKCLAAASNSGDSVFCHYSGHGGYLRDDDDGEEKDGYDETIVPVDHATAGQIRDDDLYDSLVCALPKDVTMVSVMDCCHSATVLDLPYKYRATGSSGVASFGPANSSGFSGSASGSGSGITLRKGCGILAILFFVLTIILLILHFFTKQLD